MYRTVALLSMLTLTVALAPNAAAAAVGAGDGTYTLRAPDGSTACTSDQTFAITIDEEHTDTLTIAAVPQGATAVVDGCLFTADTYLYSDDCYYDQEKNLHCNYSTTTTASAIVITPSGAFAYAYLWEDGAMDQVTGYVDWL